VVKLVRITAGHDCGFAINPTQVEGQLEGSVAGGAGQAIYEDIGSTDGSLRNANFLDYKMLTALEMPEVVNIEVETNDPNGPFGAKEAGEGTIIPTASCIANAVYNAVGVRIRELPITPGRYSRGWRKAASEPSKMPGGTVTQVATST